MSNKSILDRLLIVEAKLDEVLDILHGRQRTFDIDPDELKKAMRAQLAGDRSLIKELELKYEKKELRR